MDRRRHRAIGAALLFAIAALAACYGLIRSQSQPAPLALGIVNGQQRADLDYCRENAALVHDVHWAAACMQVAEQEGGDDSAECTLPNGRAASLHAQLKATEQECAAQAVAASPQAR